MVNRIHTLDPFYKGVLMIVAGTVLFLHTIGILERGFGLLILGFAGYLIVQGMKLTGLYDKLQKLLQKP